MKISVIKSTIIILLVQMGMLSFVFYPFYKWDKSMRNTPLEYILDLSFSAHATFILCILYTALNMYLFISLNKRKDEEIKFAERKTDEIYNELREAIEENTTLKKEIKRLKNAKENIC